jgi:hypothetical protein
MIIGSRQRVPSFEQGPIIKLGNQVIKRVPNKKTLGVILNEHLTWNKHIDEQNEKISNNYIARIKGRNRSCFLRWPTSVTQNFLSHD